PPVEDPPAVEGDELLPAQPLAECADQRQAGHRQLLAGHRLASGVGPASISKYPRPRGKSYVAPRPCPRNWPLAPQAPRAACTNASKLAPGVPRSTPWLRLTMCRRPPPAVTQARVAAATCSGVPVRSSASSTFPWKVSRG